MMKKKLLGLVLAVAMLCGSLAAFAERAPHAHAAGEYAPSQFAAVTTKPNANPTNSSNLLRAGAYNGAAGSSTDRLSTMIGSGVQETTSWYFETLGWAVFASGETGAGSNQIAISKQTGLASGTVENNTSTYARVNFSNALANNAANNVINYKSAGGGDSPLKLGGRTTSIMYFSMMVNVAQTTWFDIAIESSGTTAVTYYDLGRRFKAEPGSWTEIGKDAGGNYLPFRKPETYASGSTNTDHRSKNAASRGAATNAKEDQGSVEFALPAGDFYVRIYTYTAETGATGSNGLTGSAQYEMTNAWMFEKAWTAPIKVSGISARSRATLYSGSESGYSSYKSVTMNASGSSSATMVIYPVLGSSGNDLYRPAATNSTLNWSSSDPTVATVSSTTGNYGGTGTITAVGPGKCNVTITATDGSNVSKVIAVTVTDDINDILTTPDDLDPMEFKGESRVFNSNFSDLIIGREYGSGWTFTANAEMNETQQNSAATWSYLTNLSDAPAETALRITDNGGHNTLYDSLTFSAFHTVYDLDPDENIYYFSFWVKVNKTTWFDVNLSYAGATYSGNHYEGQKFYDLGRKFKAEPGEWVEIGLDEHGNYLPFRSMGTGSDPTSSNSSSANATNAGITDTQGNTIIDLPGDSVTDVLNWGCIRIRAYVEGVNGLDSNGIGIPSSTGYSTGDSYDITGITLWPLNAEPVIPDTMVQSITLNRSAHTIVRNDSRTLTAVITPDDATSKEVYWESSDEDIAEVDMFGVVTAKRVGTATITAYALGGNNKYAECQITVVAVGTAVCDCCDNCGEVDTDCDCDCEECICKIPVDDNPCGCCEDCDPDAEFCPCECEDCLFEHEEVNPCGCCEDCDPDAEFCPCECEDCICEHEEEEDPCDCCPDCDPEDCDCTECDCCDDDIIPPPEGCGSCGSSLNVATFFSIIVAATVLFFKRRR